MPDVSESTDFGASKEQQDPPAQSVQQDQTRLSDSTRENQDGVTGLDAQGNAGKKDDTAAVPKPSATEQTPAAPQGSDSEKTSQNKDADIAGDALNGSDGSESPEDGVSANEDPTVSGEQSQ